MDTKGIETVRRDNCGLVKNVVTEALNKILIEKSVEGAIGPSLYPFSSPPFLTFSSASPLPRA
jgi:DNA polymerase elongation subunit (family B)